MNIHYTDIEAYILSQKNKIPIYAVIINGENLKKVSLKKEGILLMGNQSIGLSDSLVQLADYKITIPKYGEAESLNVSVATGIILSHWE